MGFRRADGRVGTRNFVLIVPTSMCASHEARTLSNYAGHPNVGGVILMDLGCEKTNLSQVEKYLLKREKSFNKPVAKIGSQEAGGTLAAIERGMKEVERMLPEVNLATRERVSTSELVLAVKCGASDASSMELRP